MLPFRRILLTILLLIGFLVFACLVQWLFAFQVRPATGPAQLDEILAIEAAKVGSLGPTFFPVGNWCIQLANWVYEIVFGWTGLIDIGHRFETGAYANDIDIKVGTLYAAWYPWIHSAMVTVQLAGLRLGMLLACLPAALLFYLAGFYDGLVERAIRRDCGGRESATIYHRAKYLQLLGLCIASLLFVAWPGPVAYPAAPLLIGGATGVLARIQWKFYKKYL